MTKPPKNRRKKAVALRYDAGHDTAPRVTAKGAGQVAERIIAIALEHGIAIHEDPDLVGLLAQLDLNVEVPEHLYRAVAEVLAFVYRVNRDMA